MKKLLFGLSLIYSLNLFAAAEYDLRKGIDMTASNRVTQAMMNQLVDSGTISATNKGGIIRMSSGGSSVHPDVTLNPRYTNFLWLDTFSTPPTIRTYVCCGDHASGSNWVVTTVSPGTITTVEIKDYTILAVDMATNSVPDYALVASSVSGNKIADNGVIAGKLNAAAVLKGNFAFGAITGGDITNKTITHTNIADSGIISLNIANNTIEGSKITNGAITTTLIATTNVTRDQIRDDAIGSLQLTNGAVNTNKLAGQINNSLLHTNTSSGISKLWAVVSDTGTLLKGFNVSSSLRHNTGDFRVNFAAGFAPTDTNYVVCISPTSTGPVGAAFASGYYSNTLTSVDIKIYSVTGTDADPAHSFSIMIMQYP